MVYLRYRTKNNKLNEIFTEWYRKTNVKTRSKIAEYVQAKTKNKNYSRQARGQYEYGQTPWSVPTCHVGGYGLLTYVNKIDQRVWAGQNSVAESQRKEDWF